jgi:hypothetical protein
MDGMSGDHPPMDDGFPRDRGLANFLAALPLLVTGAAYGIAGLGGHWFLGFSAHSLVVLFQVEFAALHSGAFLPAFGSARRGKSLRKRIVWDLVFWTLVSLYMLMTLKLAWYGPLLFVAAVAGTYWSARRGWAEPRNLHPLLGRWLVNVAAYLAIVFLLGLHREEVRWDGEPKVQVAGLLYFTALGLMEWSGFNARLHRMGQEVAMQTGKKDRE